MKWLTRKSKAAAQASGYLVASAAALAVDMLITLSSGLWLVPAAAGATGFIAGTFVSYWLAKQLAFVGPKSRQEFVGYFAVGLVTLWQTTSMIYVLTAHANWSLFAAKCAAVPVSFVAGFYLRAALAHWVDQKATA